MSKKYDLLLLRSALQAYYKSVEDDPREYRSVGGRLFGYSKGDTLLAISILLFAIDVDKETIVNIPNQQYNVLQSSKVWESIAFFEKRLDLKVLPITPSSQRGLREMFADVICGYFSSVREDTASSATASASHRIFMPRQGLLFTGDVSRRSLQPKDAGKRSNNVLHDYLIETSAKVFANDRRNEPNIYAFTGYLAGSVKDRFTLLCGESLHNTPLALAIKMGRWDEVCVMIDMLEKFPDEHRKYIVERQDSMGLMPLSYALLLRAPAKVITFLLNNTSIAAYGVHDHKLSPLELYENPLPEHVAIPKGTKIAEGQPFEVLEASDEDWAEHGEALEALREQFKALRTEYFAILNKEKEGDEAGSKAELGEVQKQLHSLVGRLHKPGNYHQYLRNLLFFNADLVMSEGAPLSDFSHREIVSTTQKWALDLIYHYPQWTASRNSAARLEPEVQEAITSWMASNTLTAEATGRSFGAP